MAVCNNAGFVKINCFRKLTLTSNTPDEYAIAFITCVSSMKNDVQEFIVLRIQMLQYDAKHLLNDNSSCTHTHTYLPPSTVSCSCIPVFDFFCLLFTFITNQNEA